MKATGIPDRSRALVRARDMQRCVRCYIPVAIGHWHHRRGRSVRDRHTHHPCNGVWMCADCHRWVHAHPFEAKEKGWIVPRYVKEPGTIPFLTHRGWCLPGCGGQGRWVHAHDMSEATVLLTLQ